MAQRRFDDRAPPSGGEPPAEGGSRAQIGMGWLAQLKLRGAVANDNRVPLWSAVSGTAALLLLAALLIYASVGWLP